MLRLTHITHSFTTDKKILADESFSLERGRVYALMGGNGAGKTTLFNIISGFINIVDGEINFEGKNITRLKPYQRNRLGIGRTFQDVRIALKLSVIENIILAIKDNPTDNILNALLPPRFHRNTNDVLKTRATKIIQQCFLTDIQHSLADEISYGQQKLLLLACCLANGSTLILLDEPVAGIQPEYIKQIAILVKAQKEQGKTVLLIEHNIDFIADVADEILFLKQGKISVFTSIEEAIKYPGYLESFVY